MSSRNRIRKKRVMQRDSQRCGIHLGGCGGHITNNKDSNVDHMIPQSFFQNHISDPSLQRQFEEDWNLQPMHVACHQKNRSGQLWDFPLFRCTCHSLKIKNRNLYVRHKDDLIGPLIQILRPDAISNMPETITNNFGILGGDQKPGRYTHGRTTPSTAHKTGHQIPTLTDDQIREFNALEDKRVAGIPADSIDKFNRMLHGFEDHGLQIFGIEIDYEVVPKK